jgi:hypothetical protein
MTTNAASNQPIDVNSLTFGVVIITIPDPAVSTTYGSELPCRSCLVQQQSGTQAYMDGVTAAAATGWKLSSTTPIPVPVDDVNKIHLFGTAGDVIQILYRP